MGRFPELDDALVVRIGERRGADPLSPLTVVVGSAALRTRVGDLLVRRLGAVANVSVTTLTRFAADTVTGASGPPPRSLTKRVQERLLRRLALHGSEPLAYFAGVAARPHFAQALAATFTDLRQACIEPVPWPADKLTGQGGEKAADLERLYRAYCRELERLRLVDDADLFLAAADRVAEGAGSPVIVFGLYDLNVAQETLVRALLERGADVFVPLPRGAGDVSSPLAALAGERGLALRRWEPPHDARDVGRLAALWRGEPSSPQAGLAFAGDGSVVVVSVADERSEAREAIRAVVEAAAGGASLWDCAVVAPQAESVERLAVALAGAGLPVAAVLPDRSVGVRIVARLMDCLAPAAGGPLGRREVVELLSCATLREAVPPRQAALWRDEARRAGIVGGAAQWSSRMPRRVRGLERRVAELEAAGGGGGAAAGDEALEPLELAHDRLRAAQVLLRASGLLAREVQQMPQRAPWRAWTQVLSAVAQALFERDEAAAAHDVLARLEALDVLGEEVPLPDVAAVLRDQLADGGVQRGRVGREGVAVLTPVGLRGLRFHTVVFTGLAEGGFPARGRPDPVLGDAERRRLADGFGTRLPLAESRDAESALLFGFACEAARERLVLVAPRSEAASGRPRLPSRYLLRVAAHAAGGPVRLDEFLTGRPLAAVWRRAAGAPAPPDPHGVVWIDARERDASILLALSSQRRFQTVDRYLGDVLGAEARAVRRLGMWRAARSAEPGCWDGLLSETSCAALGAAHPFAAEIHPTRLERYVSCPFAFLLRDVLRLEAPDEPEDGLDMDRREFGSLAHEVLQRTYEAVIDGGLDVEAASAALVEAWHAACAEAEQRGVTGAPLAWQVRRAALLQDLAEVVRRDPVFAAGGGRPIAVEWSFGEAVGRPVSVTLADGRHVRFAGRVDRIDAAGPVARVIDYKTGRGEVEQKRIKAGLSVQLPVYQAAARQAGDQEHDRLTALYRLVTRRGGFADLALEEDEERTAAALLRLLAEALDLVDAGLFPRSTAGSCDYCDVRYACGTSGWTRARKRGHEVMAALVRLQTVGLREADVAGG